MTRTRGTTRVLAAASLLAAAAPLALTTVPATAAPAASTANHRTAPSLTEVSTQAGGQGAVAGTTATASGRYVAVTQSRGVQRLQIVDRRTGKVVRTLASAKERDDFRAFADVDITADGTVYALVARRPGHYSAYGFDLVRYRNGRPTVLTRYVDSYAIAPDGRSIAAVVVSPDGDGDRHGLQALRVLSMDGRVLRTLHSSRFPVGRDGEPTVAASTRWVLGWAGRSTIVLGSGCCADSDVSLVPAAKLTREGTWPFWDGEDDATALGVRGSSALVVRPTFTGDGVRVPLRRTGVEVAWLDAAHPRGRIVERIRGDLSAVDVAPRLLRRYGATPFGLPLASFRYKGGGQMLEASV